MFSPQEAELRALHEAIRAEKNKLLEEMQTGDELQESYGQSSEAAHIRNRALLRDLQDAEKSFKRKSKLGPNRTVQKLETLYWRSVEEEYPKWERFLLGKSQLPFGMKENPPKLKNPQNIQTPKRKTLPPSGYTSLPR